MDDSDIGAIWFWVDNSTPSLSTTATSLAPLPSPGRSAPLGLDVIGEIVGGCLAFLIVILLLFVALQRRRRKLLHKPILAKLDISKEDAPSSSFSFKFWKPRSSRGESNGIIVNAVPLTSKTTFVFISHVKGETGSDAVIFHDHLARRFGQSQIFLDAEESFSLTNLENQVKNSFMLLVLASPSYITRPYCMLELIAALKSNAVLVPFNIIRPESPLGFNYAKAIAEVEVEALGDTFYQNLFDHRGWNVISRAGYTLNDVKKRPPFGFLI